MDRCSCKQSKKEIKESPFFTLILLQVHHIAIRISVAVIALKAKYALDHAAIVVHLGAERAEPVLALLAHSNASVACCLVAVPAGREQCVG